MEYVPARSSKPIKVEKTNCPLIVLRSHPNFPGTLSQELEGVWSSTDPTWPGTAIYRLLSGFDPPCHTEWRDFNLKNTERKNGLEAYVILVRPGSVRATA